MTNEKIVVVEVGYYHPSDANWSYHIHLVIDGTGARMYKEAFGGDYRMKQKMESIGKTVESLHAGIGSSARHSWKDVFKMEDIENYNGYNWGDNSYNSK
jgi:hypothetical protein